VYLVCESLFAAVALLALATLGLDNTTQMEAIQSVWHRLRQQRRVKQFHEKNHQCARTLIQDIKITPAK
jgi:hypothetical protein